MELTQVYPGSAYFYYPHPICVVGMRDEARSTANFVPVAWASPLASRPPLFGVCLSPKTYSHTLITKSGEFTLSFLPWDKRELVAKLGSVSGKDTDKVKAFSLKLVEGEFVKSPYLAQAYAAAECALVDRRDFGDQTLFVGEILKIVAQEGAFDEEGLLRLDRMAPILYVGGNRYVTANPASLQLFSEGS